MLRRARSDWPDGWPREAGLCERGGKLARLHHCAERSMSLGSRMAPRRSGGAVEGQMGGEGEGRAGGSRVVSVSVSVSVCVCVELHL
jgi:hypothetical protein